MADQAPTFIVTFKQGVTTKEIDAYAEQITSEGGTIVYRYDMLGSLAAKLPASCLQSLKGSEHIEGIEADSIVTTQ